MYDGFVSEAKKTPLLGFPFVVSSQKKKHDNIIGLLQSSYATEVVTKKTLIQSKLTYLRDRVKNSSYIPSNKKQSYSDTFEIVAGTVFERNSTVEDLNVALKTLSEQDTAVSTDIEAVRKEFVFTEIDQYKSSCQTYKNYFVEKNNFDGVALADSCVLAADTLLEPQYRENSADFIESLSRERVFALVQKVGQAKQQLEQDEQYAFLQKKKEEERLTLVPPAPRQDGKVIVVNITLQRLYAYSNGISLFPQAVPITTGKQGFETVQGDFAVYLKERFHKMTSPFPGIYYDDVVQYWMPFYLGYGLHDAAWRTVYGTQDYSTVGSHGCVNIPLNDTIILYNWAEVGTRVLVI